MNRIDKIAKKIVSAANEPNDAGRKMHEACVKYSFNHDNDGHVDVEFRYDQWNGLAYFIGMWSGNGGDRSFNDCIKATKKREALLTKAKANYKILVDLKKKLGLPGDVMAM